ncbi:hypothetical protein D3C86_1430550 [compost metagenome]
MLAVLFAVYMVLNIVRARKKRGITYDEFFIAAGKKYVIDFYRSVITDIVVVAVMTGLCFYVGAWSIALYFLLSMFVHWAFGIRAIYAETEDKDE